MDKGIGDDIDYKVEKPVNDDKMGRQIIVNSNVPDGVVVDTKGNGKEKNKIETAFM